MTFSIRMINKRTFALCVTCAAFFVAGFMVCALWYPLVVMKTNNGAAGIVGVIMASTQGSLTDLLTDPTEDNAVRAASALKQIQQVFAESNHEHLTGKFREDAEVQQLLKTLHEIKLNGMLGVPPTSCMQDAYIECWRDVWAIKHQGPEEADIERFSSEVKAHGLHRQFARASTAVQAIIAENEIGGTRFRNRNPILDYIAFSAGQLADWW